jgi:hypothetical protein
MDPFTPPVPADSAPPTPVPVTGYLPPAAPGPSRRWPRRLLTLLPLVGIGGAAAYVEAFNPTDPRHEITGACAWHAVTGINGPTCGGTRAFYYLIHGDLVDAVRFHLPFVVAAPVLAYWWAAWVAQVWFGRQLPRLRPKPWVIVTYVVASLVFTTVLRNLAVPGLHWFDIPNSTHRMT